MVLLANGCTCASPSPRGGDPGFCPGGAQAVGAWVCASWKGRPLIPASEEGPPEGLAGGAGL